MNKVEKLILIFFMYNATYFITTETDGIKVISQICMALMVLAFMFYNPPEQG